LCLVLLAVTHADSGLTDLANLESEVQGLSDQSASSAPSCESGFGCTSGCTAGSSTYQCAECPAGKISGGVSGCALCTGDTFRSTARGGANDCVACTATAQVALADKTGCQCAGGYGLADVQTGSSTVSQCTECHPGKFSPVGDTACADCADNHYTSVKWETSCTQCAEGKVHNSGKTGCECAGGTQSSGATCTACDAGQFSAVHDGTSGCSWCTGNTYSASGATVCSSCTSGAAPAGANKVKSANYQTCQCNAGYGPAGGTAGGACSQCASGKFSPGYDTACSVCTGNTYSAAGASACTTCASGQFAKADNTGCDEAKNWQIKFKSGNNCICRTGSNARQTVGAACKTGNPDAKFTFQVQKAAAGSTSVSDVSGLSATFRKPCDKTHGSSGLCPSMASWQSTGQRSSGNTQPSGSTAFTLLSDDTVQVKPTIDVTNDGWCVAGICATSTTAGYNQQWKWESSTDADKLDGWLNKEGGKCPNPYESGSHFPLLTLTRSNCVTGTDCCQ